MGEPFFPVARGIVSMTAWDLLAGSHIGLISKRLLSGTQQPLGEMTDLLTWQ